ncbi:phosphatase PAP2 family protein [Salinispora tropica]|uniref:Phosphoesterase, PA-phosphatase related n=1 Tax=Salinispora tropica (strain ATCC BAA-916 / DSM 44818 / JCM 13857 / NBRC 105044 / CNB-440) TaxID=369723 RepID=A4XCT6_SALTO|nr:phosphatase PAP2 family protein [Salinispora tropica]ABP56743.1 phosphoesterase, PA-phosphatase related [Salinispora tropica CNB-440]
MCAPGPGTTARPSWRYRRLHPDDALGLRLTLTVVSTFLVLVPFLLALLVLASWSPLRRLDRAVTEALVGYGLRHPGWAEALNVWTEVFGPMPLRLGALVVVGWLARRRARQLALWVAVTMAVGGLLGPLVKLLVGRPRPELPEPLAQAVGLAFPSGHALNAALAAGVLLVVFRPRPGRSAKRYAVWAAAFLLTVVTGFSRVALGVHWSSDVVAGWLLGAAVVAATAAVFTVWRAAPARPRRPPRRNNATAR